MTMNGTHTNGGASAPPRMSLASIKRGATHAPMRVLLYGPEGIGKAQPLEAKVLTPDGFVPIGSLAVGDEVIGANGKPSRVIGVFPQGKKPVFRVVTTDGAQTECCDEHLWFTRTVNESASGSPGRVRSLREIRESLLHRPGDLDYPNHRLPTVAAVQFAELESALPLDPYVLGVILGDGTVPRDEGGVRVDKPEPDLMPRVAARLPAGDEARAYTSSGFSICRAGQRRGGSMRLRSSTRLALETLGIAGMDSINKFVPPPYLRASIQQRIDLLRGLFDTDGHVIASGARVEYSTSSDRLCEDVLDLVRGLGGTVTVERRAPHHTYLGERRVGAPSWRLLAYFPNGLVPVSSAKHLARWRTDQRQYHRSIASIEPVGEKECVCIKVDAPDELYVTDDYVVTHNTTFGADAPSPVFLGTEDGFGLLDVARFPEPRTWRDVTDALLVLEREKHEYRTLVLDSLDWLEPLVWAEVCRSNGKRSIEDFGYGKGYVAALDTWRALLASLDRLRRAKSMHVVLLAHAKVARFNNLEGSDYDRFTLKIHEKAAGLAKEWSDAVLFANFTGVFVAKDDSGKSKGKAVGTPTRAIFTERRAAFEAKNRYALPPELPLSWADFEAAATALRDPAPLLKEIETLAARAPADKAAAARAFAKEQADNYPRLLACLDRLRALVPAAPAQTDTPDHTE